MKTTLYAIKNCAPCPTGWRTLLKHLGKTEAEDAPISLLTILESNGFEDALRGLRVVEGFDREKRLFAVFCAKQVKHLMHDKRSLEAIEVAERYANGLVTEEELADAWADARDAVKDASDASAANAANAAWVVARGANDASATVAAVAAVAANAARAAARAARIASAARVAASAAARVAIRIEKEQEQEFVRMLNCIENGEVYTI